MSKPNTCENCRFFTRNKHKQLSSEPSRTELVQRWFGRGTKEVDRDDWEYRCDMALWQGMVARFKDHNAEGKCRYNPRTEAKRHDSWCSHYAEKTP